MVQRNEGAHLRVSAAAAEQIKIAVNTSAALPFKEKSGYPVGNGWDFSLACGR